MEGDKGKDDGPRALEDAPDPADKYKHVAVVDCSKAFSN